MNKICKKTAAVFAAAVLIMQSVMCGEGKAAVSASAADGKPVPVISYETDRDYDFSSAAPVDVMSYGKRALGTLRISGNFNADTTYKDFPAYGVESGEVTLNYDYDGSLLDSNGAHYIESDDRLFGNSAGKGRLEIQKSATGIEWKKAANPIDNFFEANSGGKADLYTINGGELAKGMFFRVMISYETKESSGSKIKPDSAAYHVELYEFYVCCNSGVISLHDLGATVDAVNGVKDTGYTSEQISKGETIKDGGTTVRGFSVDTLGASYSVLVNGKNASNGDRFTYNGRYDIKVKTRLGKETDMTVYVFNGGKDSGRSTYFEDYLVTEKRIFREGFDMAFARNAVMKLKPTDDSVPPLTGTLTEMNSGKKVLVLDGSERAEKSVTLSPGDYTADLYSGEKSSGSYYHYTYRFTVLDESPAPYVNRHNIECSERQQDFKPKHYEVAYETAGGGSLYVCFDSYDEAYRYAYDIEKRALQRVEGGLLYWIDKGKSNQKEVFATETKADKLKLTKLLCDNAEKNIEIAYFDPSKEFTSQTINITGMTDDDIDKELEEMSVRESLRLFSDEKNKESLKAGGIHIINGYKFMKIGGGDYDAKTITAESDKLGEPVEISTGSVIDKQRFPSSVLNICEKNKYGDENTYSVTYLADNTTIVTLRAMHGDREMIYKLAAREDTEEITADAVSFTEAFNALDPFTIVSIESDVYPKEDSLTCYADELKGLLLYRKGKYKVTFIDRAGKVFKILLMITGKSGYDEISEEGSKTYPELFNEVHIARKIKEEDR